MIDTSFVARGPSGTGVYVEQLVAALRRRGQVEVVETSQRHRLRPGRSGARWNPLRSAANALLDLAWRHRDLPRAARRAGADVLHHPLPAHSLGARCAQVVTVHDVAFARRPDRFDPLWRRLARRGHPAAVRRSDAVICVSEATRRDAELILGAAPERTVVAHHGPGQPLPAIARREPRHFLYIGDDEPRKNVDGLLAAYSAYRMTREHPLALVLAGGAAARAGAPGVVGEPAPSAERLAELHAAAAALVHPSVDEGFGLTLVEAMSAGTPVIAARNAAVVEVTAGAAMLVEPDGLADALRRLHGDPRFAGRLAERGLERAADFSWERSAQRHEEAYTLAVAAHGRIRA